MFKEYRSVKYNKKYLFRTFFLAIILLLSLGTVMDDGKEGSSNFEKLLNAFSLKRNFKKILDISDETSRVKGVDAFRGVNAFCLLLAHKSMAMAHSPYVNKISYSAVSALEFLQNAKLAFVNSLASRILIRKVGNQIFFL